LLTHDAEHPSNPPDVQQREVIQLLKGKKKRKKKKNWKAVYPSGTVIRMPGNTIHAGPPSDPTTCRAIFFYAASCDNTGSFYDPETQWNQVVPASANEICAWLWNYCMI
jgi:hypothetical protein